jgi:hypothetical protein
MLAMVVNTYSLFSIFLHANAYARSSGVIVAMKVISTYYGITTRYAYAWIWHYTGYVLPVTVILHAMHMLSSSGISGMVRYTICILRWFVITITLVVNTYRITIITTLYTYT